MDNSNLLGLPEQEQLNQLAGRPFLKMLQGHQFAEIDRLLLLAQHRFEAGESKEMELQNLLRSFAVADIRLGEHFSEWFNRTPIHYSKQLALGWWLLQMGWEARGGRTSNHVGDRGWRDLINAQEQADEAFQAALKLSEKPFHAYLLKANIEQTSGNKLSLNDVSTEHYPEWYQQGLRLYPESYSIRSQLLLKLRTEWGGSEEMMLTYVRQQEQQGFFQSQQLWAEYHALVSHYHANFTNNHQAALERAKMAAQLNPKKYRPLLFDALDAAKAPQEEQEQVIQEIIRDLTPDQSLGTNFYLAFTHAQKWFAPYVAAMGNHMLRRAQRGDNESLLMLGYYCLYRSNFDWPNPISLLEEARDAGNIKAAGLLVRLKRKELKDTGQEGNSEQLYKLRIDILKAAQLGDGDNCWQVVAHFRDFERQFNLSEQDRLDYSLMGADSGNNNARELVANQILENNISLGDNDKLGYIDEETPPTQRSLDYARHLLQRGAASGSKECKELLQSVPEWRWDAQAVQRNMQQKRPIQSSENSASNLSGIKGFWNRIIGRK